MGINNTANLVQGVEMHPRPTVVFQAVALSFYGNKLGANRHFHISRMGVWQRTLRARYTYSSRDP